MFLYLRILKAEIVREVKEAWQYRTGFLADLLTQFLLYVGLLFTGKFTWLLREYTMGIGESRGLFLLGYIFWSYSILALSQMGSDIAREATVGTLEQKFMAITPPPLLLMGKAIGGVTISSILAAIMIVASSVLLGVKTAIPAAAFLALGIALAGMYGMGFIFAGIVLLAKKTGQLIFLVQMALLFLSGTFMPLEEMPLVVAEIGRSIPLTRGIDIARRAAGNYVSPGFQDWLMLIAISAIWLVIGLIVFSLADRRARQEGLLGRY